MITIQELWALYDACEYAGTDMETTKFNQLAILKKIHTQRIKHMEAMLHKDNI